MGKVKSGPLVQCFGIQQITKFERVEVVFRLFRIFLHHDTPNMINDMAFNQMELVLVPVLLVDIAMDPVEKNLRE